jgi:hypothetical protein
MVGVTTDAVLFCGVGSTTSVDTVAVLVIVAPA